MKINRMFEMIYILLYKKSVSAKKFAEYFNVSTRTIYRYVDELSASNVPIYMKKGRNGGIALLPDYTLNQAMLSSKNKQEILGALNAFYALKPEYNQETIHKLNGIFPNTVSSWLEVDFSYWHSNTINADTFDKIQTAILNDRKIEFQYYDSSQNVTARTVQPIKLVYKAMDWYIYAFCELREKYRFFKIKRMRNLTITETLFSNHLEININDAFPSSQKKDKEIKLRFSKELLNIIIEEFSDFVFDDHGDILITVFVESYEQVIAWILSYGHYCTVLYPNTLIEMIQNECEKTLHNYS